ncbi:hypothetical protein PU634_11205 [Oceanimonas pelagia]|uniref:Uncharacterized protein n=1 Tax=Oceanimonas pelagia TaxID=3028314 RepID=A0AA50Q968_9GAMM|nr:hypothetical protein [Oceanimonas pelagia]WMC09683.1 hypothetical protein PU634_11205 [Oceanimonas pelagia]
MYKWIFLGGAAFLAYKMTSNEPPDYSKPHEYIHVKGYDSSGDPLEGNDHNYFGVGLINLDNNYYSVGSRECSQAISKITQDEVDRSIDAFNYHLDTQGDYNDKRVHLVVAQCFAYLGRDEECERRVREMVESGDKKMMIYALASIGKCRVNEEVGEPKLFRHSMR